MLASQKSIPYFWNVQFVRVSSLVGRCLYNVLLIHVYQKVWNCVFLKCQGQLYICPCQQLILDFPLTYRNASVLCESECTCLHKPINMVVLKMTKIPTQKGEKSWKCTELDLKRKEAKIQIWIHSTCELHNYVRYAESMLYKWQIKYWHNGSTRTWSNMIKYLLQVCTNNYLPWKFSHRDYLHLCTSSCCN